MTSSSLNRSGLAALVIMILLWGYSWIIMKQVLLYSGPFDFVALRYIGGAVMLFLLLLLRGESLKPTPIKLTLAVGLCQTTGFQALAQLALVSGGAGHVSLLAYTMPFWVVLLAWWLLRDKPTRWQWAGLALAGIGLVCIIEPWNGLGDIRGVVLAVVSGLCWALGTVLSKRMFILYAPSPLSFTAWQMAFGAVVLGIIALLVPWTPVRWTWPFIAGLAYSIVLATGVAWLLWSYVVNRLPATVAGLSSLGVPITAVLLAWLLLGEHPGPMEMVGIVLIMVGLLAVSGTAQKILARRRA